MTELSLVQKPVTNLPCRNTEPKTVMCLLVYTVKLEIQVPPVCLFVEVQSNLICKLDTVTIHGRTNK